MSSQIPSAGCQSTRGTAKHNTRYDELTSPKPTQAEFTEISDALLETLRSATERDESLQTLTVAIKNGWSQRMPRNATLQAYWAVRDELCVENGIIFKGNAAVIPKSERAEFLQRTHSAHLGADAMKRRVRNTIYWPGIGNDVDNLARGCEACLTYQIKQRKEPLINKPVPNRPWQVVHQDLFMWEDENYLVTVDGFSDYIEIDELGRSTTTRQIIRKTEAHFARHGRPSEMHTDSDPRYRGSEFQEFLRKWKVKHVISAPHHHQANGKSESAVKIAKRLVKKTKHMNQNFAQSLLEHRLTPQQDGLSPAFKLYNRHLSSLMPIRERQLETSTAKQVQTAIQHRREKQKSYFDRGSRQLPEIRIGQEVRMQPTDFSHEWKPARCLEQINARTYLVETNDGTRYVRNRRFLAARPPQMRSATSTTNNAFDSSQAITPEGSERNGIPTVSPDSRTGGQRIDQNPPLGQHGTTSESSQPLQGSTMTPALGDLMTRSGRVVRMPVKLNL